MVYAYDQWAQMPVKDLYDTQIMAMAINAAKDMYDKGEQAIKDFKKEYGDFLSPIQNDMNWYRTNVTGKIKDTINRLYEQGIDPIRSAEGRAIIGKAISDIDTGLINQMRQSAETKKLFNAAAIKMGQKYNKKFADWDFARRHKGIRPDDWDTERDGVFTDPTPVEYQTLQEMVHPSFSAIKPHMLSKEDVESRGYQYDPNNDYTGIVRSDMERAMGQWMPGVRDDSNFIYHRELARFDLIREGIDNPTEDQIDAKLVDNAITADSQVMTPIDFTPNKFALLKAEGDQQIRVAGAKAKIDYDYDVKRSENLGGGGNKTGNVPVIFREAAAREGGEVDYDVYENPHYQWIDPIVPGARIVKGKSNNYGYNIPASSIGYLYKKNERATDGSRISAHWFNLSDGSFIPTGQMRMELDLTGRPHYYITGTLVNNSTGKEVQGTQGTELYEMEVTERAYNYGKKQATAYKPTN